MGPMGSIAQKIRRRETPLTEWLYWRLRAVRSLSMPVIPGVHSLLYHERALRRGLWDRLKKGLYHEPLFKTRCASVGRNLRIEEGGGTGMPWLEGGLHLHLGNDVRLMDKTTLVGMTVGDSPTLRIGDRSYLGPGVSIYSAKSVEIGADCMIASTIVTDNPGHPMLDTVRRLQGGTISLSEARPVRIGDFVWLATGTYVFPGVTIGDGVIALPGAQIGGMDVPPFCMVSGSPARVVAKLPLPAKLKEIVGEERYAAYKQAHREMGPIRPQK